MALGEWSTFFAAEVGASASLVGLVTVAISINLRRILEHEQLPPRAGESLFSLTTVFVTCSVGLFPAISAKAFGIAAWVLAVASLLFGARNQWMSRKFPGEVAIVKQIVGAAGRLAATVPIAYGGALLWTHDTNGAIWIAIGIVISLAVSVMNAWVLLVEIMR